jgi:predicted acylesterase/phospholipase RssA
LLECDLVLKGGITSGVVYPQALERLAHDYRFRSIGGASAGAIAAGLAAAAEYRRQVAGDARGFSLLNELPNVLGESKGENPLLLELFQPQARFRPFFRFLMAFARQSERSGDARALLVARGAVQNFPLHTWLGAISGGALAALIGLVGGHFTSAAGVLLFVVGAVLLAVVGAALGALSGIWRAVTELPLNGFGLCRGYDETPGVPQLTSWLHEQIQAAAGLSPEKPLTFGQLREWGIALKVITSNLGYRAPHTVPFGEGEAWAFYDPRLWSALFPPEVMQHLVDASERCLDDARHENPKFADAIELVQERHGLLILPQDELPILVAVRLSLSFPVLLSAVPLSFVDPPDRGSGKARSCWLSDGGISSNFPVHFFDAPIPARPTFAINLEEVDDDFEGPLSWVAKTNQDGLRRPWVEMNPEKGLSSLLAFLLAIFDTMQNWRDNSRLRLPGYRDRVAAVRLKPGEGGLNLNMTPARITDLAARGRAAADELAVHFNPERSSELPSGVKTTWDNHRWVRLLSALSGMETLLEEFENAWQAPSPLTPSYQDLLDPKRTANSDLPSYGGFNRAQRELALACLTRLRHALAEEREKLSAPSMTENSPRPALRFRLTGD